MIPEQLAARGLRVNPLVWVEDRHSVHYAKCMFGEYSVGFDDGWWAQLEGPNFWEWDAPECPRSYSGPFAAKAAAEADHVARVGAMIEGVELGLISQGDTLK